MHVCFISIQRAFIINIDTCGVFVWVSLIRRDNVLNGNKTNRFFLQQTDLRSRLKFITLPVILQSRIGMKYCDWVAPMSATENRLRKLVIVFECYDT